MSRLLKGISNYKFFLVDTWACILPCLYGKRTWLCFSGSSCYLAHQCAVFIDKFCRDPAPPCWGMCTLERMNREFPWICSICTWFLQLLFFNDWIVFAETFGYLFCFLHHKSFTRWSLLERAVWISSVFCSMCLLDKKKWSESDIWACFLYEN